MKRETKLLIVGLILGAVIGYGVRIFTETDHFVLKDAPGIQSAVYKLDTRTGRMWLVSPVGETPIQ